MKFCRFFIEGDIQTKARPRATIIAGHATIYTPKDTLYYENYVKSCYKEQCGTLNFEDKPLEINISFNFLPNQEIRELCKDTETNPIQIECTNHKDLDNLAKIILDGLNGLAFIDDKNIVKLTLSKSYTNDPREYVVVEIMELPTLTIQDLKNLKKKRTLQERIDKLQNKETLGKADKEKLERYINELHILEL